MNHWTSTAAAVGLALAACASGSDDGATIARWSLTADADGALVDARRPELGPYPNPRGASLVEVTLAADGALCAVADGTRFCGGVAQGIPYRAAMTVRDGRVCVRVSDMFGDARDEVCHGDLGVLPEARPGCRLAQRADGAPCEVCTGPDGYLVETTCGGAGDLPSMPPAVGPLCPEGASHFPSGVRLYVEAYNRGLTQLGVTAQLPVPEHLRPVEWELADTIPLDAATCAQLVEESDIGRGEIEADLFDAEDVEDCRTDGRCRIGQLTSWAMREACRAQPPACDGGATREGVLAAAAYAVEATCPGDDQYVAFDAEVKHCRGSPLVLDLDGDGVALTSMAAGVRFPLMSERAVSTGWIAAGDDALLARDLDHDGVIDSGRELFGQATGGGATDGFAALARYDADRNGRIDARDPVFWELMAWRDDGDGRTEPAELTRLVDLGVQAIELDVTPLDRVQAGNRVSASARVSRRGGAVTRVFDVWFEFSGRPPRVGK